MKKLLLLIFFGFYFSSLSAQTNTSSLNFNGTDAYVEVADAVTLNPTSALSIEAWIKPDSFGTTAFSNYIVGKDDWSVSSAGYCLRCGAGGELSFNFSNGVGTWEEALSTSVIPIGSWSHVAATFDGTKLTLYINGVQAGTLSYTGSIYSSTYPIRIGAVPFTLGGTRLFSGNIDQVEIWNKALTPNEVNLNMACSPMGNELGLVGLWKFEEGVGTTSADLSPFVNNATLVNGTSWSTDAPTLSCAVGITENKSNVVGLYPNPSNGNFIITFNQFIETGFVQIYSALGEICFTEKINNRSSLEIFSPSLSSGIYFVKITANGKETMMKLVVK